MVIHSEHGYLSGIDLTPSLDARYVWSDYRSDALEFKDQWEINQWIAELRVWLFVEAVN